MYKTTWFGNEGLSLLIVQVQQRECFSSANIPYLHKYSLDFKPAVVTVTTCDASLQDGEHVNLTGVVDSLHPPPTQQALSTREIFISAVVRLDNAFL